MSSPTLAAVALQSRLVRRGVAVVSVCIAAYAAVEVASYRITYPDAASRTTLTLFARDPASRMLQGLPHGVETAGGFVAWDGGWMIVSIGAVWSLLLTARLLRGEEDDDRTALVLAAPLRATRWVGVQLAAVTTGCLAYGLAVTLTLGAAGEQWLGSLQLGLATAGLCAVFAGVAAVFAQVFDERRRVTFATAGVLAAAFGVRMVANSADARGGLRWLTPYGWVDEVEPFAAQRWGALALLWVTWLALVVTAVALRTRRDTGGALVVGDTRRAPHERLLAGPTAFAWRTTRAVLFGWVVGVGVWNLLMGSLLGTMMDFLAGDENYRRVLAAMGLDLAATTKGFLGVMGVMCGMVYALYACWRIAAARAEEQADRLPALLARPLSRRRWLAGHVLLAVLGIVALAVVSGISLWVGARLGDADVTLDEAMRSVLNPVPVAVLFCGVAVLLLGATPRLALSLPVGLTVGGYVLELVGPALSWPDAVLGVSPFHHLAYVPAEPFALTAAVVLTAVGMVAIGLGVVAFEHRDLT